MDEQSGAGLVGALVVPLLFAALVFGGRALVVNLRGQGPVVTSRRVASSLAIAGGCSLLSAFGRATAGEAGTPVTFVGLLAFVGGLAWWVVARRRAPSS